MMRMRNGSLAWTILVATFASATRVPVEASSHTWEPIRGNAESRESGGFVDVVHRVTYAITIIDVPVTSAFPLGVNDRAQVVGSYYDESNHLHGFLYDRGTFSTIEPPSPGNNWATGINDQGQVVGLYNAFGPGGSHGYLDDGGSFGTIDVPFLGASSTYALGINARGQIVGGFASSGRRAFLYEQGAFTTIDVPFTGAFSTTAFAINDGGQIVGTYYDDLNNPHRHGFLYDRGIFTTIDVPFPGASLVDFYGITGINNRGQITGNYMDSPCTSQSCVQHGFLYDGGEFVTIDFPGFPFTSVGGINNRGQFVGSYCAGGVFPPSCHVFMATPNDDGREHDISGAY